MTSERHNVSGQRYSDDAVLDAARACVLAVGVRRTTLTDVARRAGVSRMTIYRRWPDTNALIGDLMTREWRDVVAATASRPSPGPVRAGLVAGLVDCVRTLRAHPLFRKIADVDPEVLLPYILKRRGTSQDTMLDTLVAALRQGHADGSVRPGDPERQARAVLLTAQSFALSAHTMAADDDPVHGGAELDEELAVLLDRYLAA